LFKLLDKTVGLRVSTEEELEGLDLAEHGGVAYPDFAVASHGGMTPVPGQSPAPKVGVRAPLPVRQN
jgi:Amt family ammonium transporter